ncbi:MAG: response regulator [Selenomonadaceae bacterium]|nr:response regulator [Selenomonadaceae bacterium]
MNEDGFSLNEKYIKKIILQFATVLGILILTGFSLRAEVNDLLNATLEKMIAKQAADLSIVAEEKFSKELAELKLAAEYLSAHPNDAAIEKNFLAMLQAGDENISVGMLSLNERAIHGKMISKWDFLRFTSVYRGNEIVDYCAGKGMLFAVPVMRGGNVRAVIYRLYNEKILTDLFGLAEYNSDAKLLIQERNGQIIVPYKNYGEADKKFFMNSTIQLGFKRIRDNLATRMSSATYCESSLGKFFLFATDLPQTNCTMIGYVPWVAVAGDIFRIYTLLLIGGTLMLIFLALVSAYLFVMRTKAEESDALREAKQAAEDANNAKSVFLAGMSHEIRTPINAIIGMNEMILRESDNPEIIGYAQNASAASESLLSLINDILDFSKIESGKMELVEENYKLADVIKSLITMMKPRAEKKNLAFNLQVNPATGNNLFGDSVRIRQIALNFLSNAVKYTRVGSVDFIVDGENISDDAINLKFTVKDTGIGIREEDIPKLFNDFERFDAKKNKNIEGTGLGLAITNKLVAMMNGKIEVQSVYGEGSVFMVTIPQKVIGNEPIGKFTEEHAAPSKKYAPSFIAPDAEILIVDDNEMNLLVAESLLKATKIKIDTALSGMSCLKKLTERHYDLIFLDQMMPSLDGIQTLKMARAMGDNLSKDAPIIALTANAISGTREKLIGEGFTDYLSKPIDVKLMEQMLMNYLPTEKIKSPDAEENLPVEEKSEPKSELINVETGLEYSAGMTDLYKDFLLKFVSLKADKQKKLQAAFEAQDWKNYTIYVHALKSTALSIGGEKVSAAAKELEISGKIITAATSSELEKHESMEFIEKNHAATMKLYDELTEEARRLAETL